MVGKLKTTYYLLSLSYLSKQTNKKEITIWRLIVVRERVQDQDSIPRAKEPIQQTYTEDLVYTGVGNSRIHLREN